MIISGFQCVPLMSKRYEQHPDFKDVTVIGVTAFDNWGESWSFALVVPQTPSDADQRRYREWCNAAPCQDTKGLFGRRVAPIDFRATPWVKVVKKDLRRGPWKDGRGRPNRAL